MRDVVFSGSLSAGYVATMLREGLTWFDFSGTSLDVGKIDLNDAASLGRHIDVLHRRAEVLTFHSVCIAKAIQEATGASVPQMCLITPENLLSAGPSIENPTCDDDLIKLYFFSRSQKGYLDGLPEFSQHTPITRLLVPERVARRSFELFDVYFVPSDSRKTRSVDFIVRASKRLLAKDYSESLVLAWTAIEQSVAKQWDDYLSEKFNVSHPAANAQLKKRVKKLQDQRSYTVSVRIEILNQLGRLDHRVFHSVEGTRKSRNKLMHEMQQVHQQDALDALVAARDLFEIAFKMPISIAISSGYTL
jgi:hypothetical protein